MALRLPRSGGERRRRPLHMCSLNLKKNGSTAVLACKFAPKGDVIVSGSSDKTLKLWDVTSGKCQATLQGHRYLCWFVRLRRRPLPAQRGRGVDDHYICCSLTFIQNGSNAVSACKFAPDGKILVSASWDRTLKLWDVESGKCQATLECHRYLLLCVPLRRRPLPAQRGRSEGKPVL